MIWNLVEGQTAPVYRYLRIDNAVPTNPDGTALSMEGMTATMEVHEWGAGGDEVPITGAVTIQDAAAWLIKYSPVANEHLEGTYRARIAVVDGAGKLGYFPNAEGDKMVIRKP